MTLVEQLYTCFGTPCLWSAAQNFMLALCEAGLHYTNRRCLCVAAQLSELLMQDSKRRGSFL